MIKHIFEKCIHIDFDDEIQYGQDQIYDKYPIVFPTVTFRLLKDDILDMVADKIRKECGFVEDNPFPEWWYDYYIGVSDINGVVVDSCIQFIVWNSDLKDDGKTYDINLLEDEQRFLYDILNDQCVEHLNKTLVDLLNEAGEKMK